MVPKKKLKKPNEQESDESDDTVSSIESDEEYSGNEVIQVEFEGRNPMTSDFHGVRQLLQQLFLKSDINLSVLADTVTDQNFVGSVVIQSFSGDVDEEHSDDDSETIYGVTSAVNISGTHASGCIEDIRKSLLSKCEQYAAQADKAAFKRILDDDKNHVGLIINERFINIPAQISVPLLENLHNEIQAASVKKEKFRFGFYVIIIKFSRKKGNGDTVDPLDDIYSNGEEEVFNEYGDASFEYSVEHETDSTLSGNWSKSDSVLVPYRKVVTFDAAKFPVIINAIKELFNE